MRLRLASSSGAWRTSSSSCLIIEPMRMTFAGCSTDSTDSFSRASTWRDEPSAMTITGAPCCGSSTFDMRYRSCPLSARGYQQRHEHLGGRERSVPGHQAHLARIGRIEERDRREGDDGHVAEPLLDRR